MKKSDLAFAPLPECYAKCVQPRRCFAPSADEFFPPRGTKLTESVLKAIFGSSEDVKDDLKYYKKANVRTIGNMVNSKRLPRLADDRTICAALFCRRYIEREEAEAAEEEEESPRNDERLLLALDLDDTLICTRTLREYNDVNAVIAESKIIPGTFSFRCDGFVFVVQIRPGVKEFLEWANERFDVGMYTNAHSTYVDEVMKRLDPERRYFPASRTFTKVDSCTFGNLFSTKDLRKFKRDLSRVILVDNSANAFLMHPHNGIPIVDFVWNDVDDVALAAVRRVLETTLMNCDDVRPVLRTMFKIDESIEDVTHGLLTKTRIDYANSF